MSSTFRQRFKQQEKERQNEVQTIIRPNYAFHPNYGIQLDCPSYFNDRGRYYSIPGGNRYPSVTTVLSGTKSESSKKALDAWAERLGGPEAAEKEKKRAADRGTTLHNLIESFFKGENLNYGENPLFRQIYPNLKRINNIHLFESALYSHKLKIAGRVDCIAEFDNTLSIIDFKGSTKDKESHYIQDYYIQETAYAIMYSELYNLKVKQIVTLVAVENSNNGQVFIEKPINFVDKLVDRINTYYGQTI